MSIMISLQMRRDLFGFPSAKTHLRYQVLHDRLRAPLTVRPDYRPAFRVCPAAPRVLPATPIPFHRIIVRGMIASYALAHQNGEQLNQPGGDAERPLCSWLADGADYDWLFSGETNACAVNKSVIRTLIKPPRTAPRMASTFR
jgi:hypothetical protein